MSKTKKRKEKKSDLSSREGKGTALNFPKFMKFLVTKDLVESTECMLQNNVKGSRLTV